jgi:AGCS family alanine or glycine:cation symporter
MMGILAIVNLLALLMLFPIAKRLIVDFAAQLKAGIDRPVLDPDKYSDLEIDHSAWNGNLRGR